MSAVSSAWSGVWPLSSPPRFFGSSVTTTLLPSEHSARILLPGGEDTRNGKNVKSEECLTKVLANTYIAVHAGCFTCSMTSCLDCLQCTHATALVLQIALFEAPMGGVRMTLNRWRERCTNRKCRQKRKMFSTGHLYLQASDEK